jgi:pSer/pThr/pTyr-binding forkhead associated (FHA) protein
MPKLHFTDKNFEGRTYELVVERTSVGRGEHNTLVIADDSVSVNHCDILVYGQEVIVRERGSSNGTFVDEVRVEGQMPVHHGQILQFGSVVARVEVEPGRRPDETTTDLTAVYEYGKVMREQRREKKKAAGAHLRIEPSAAHVATEEEQTVLLPNPRSTQKLKKVAMDAAPRPEPVRPAARGNRTAYLIAGIVALLAAILIWLFRR